MDITYRPIGVVHSRIEVEGLDLLDGTPVLDVKPHVPETAAEDEVRIGWITRGRLPSPAEGEET